MSGSAMDYEFTRLRIQAEKSALMKRIGIAVGIGALAAASVASLYGLSEVFDWARAAILGVLTGAAIVYLTR